MRLGPVGRVEDGNRSDLDSHEDCCVCGKELLVFNYFDREVTVSDWDPEGLYQKLWVTLYQKRGKLYSLLSIRAFSVLL
jgi:hypothetical protein